MIRKHAFRVLAVISVVAFMLAAAGCGGGGGAKRVAGLSSDGTVKTFFEAAKGGRLNEAALYISPATAKDPRVMLKYLTGQTGLEELKNTNLVSLRKVAEQGDYAVVVATLQTQNSLRLTVKPVALERIKGEWYIVDLDKVYQDAKYYVLQQLLNRI